jgi:hypothetical protein
VIHPFPVTIWPCPEPDPFIQKPVIDRPDAGFSLTPYPNPTSDHISFSGPFDGGIYQLKGIYGNVIMSGKLVGGASILDLTSLAPGLYWVTVSSGKDVFTTPISVVR